MVDNFIGDTGKYDLFGVKNGFRKLLDMYIRQLVDDGKWFTVCHRIDDSQVDLMSIQNGEGMKLGRLLADTYSESQYRVGVYKYMLRNYLCYIEVPTMAYRTDTGARKSTFNKVLATSNLNVVAEWLGVSVDELPEKYRTRLYTVDINDGEDSFPYVKLSETPKSGVRRGICPKKDIDLSESGTRVIPLFMLNSGVDSLYSKMKEDIVKVSFMKDGGQIRDMFTSTNLKKIEEIYGKGDFLDGCIFSSYEGIFLENPNLSRGYIRVPEIGGSRYDNPVRSINYARIISIEYGAEPNLAFINIDLSTVLEGFQEGVVKYSSQASDIIEMLEMTGLETSYWNPEGYRVGGRDIVNQKTSTSLLQWSDSKATILSTVFLRKLCLFMLGNPQWFGDFTGTPKDRLYSSDNIGLA